MFQVAQNKDLSEKIIKYAQSLIPENLSVENKEYLIKKMNNFSYIAGEVFWNDDFSNFSEKQKDFIVQIVSGESFKVLIELVNSNISQKYWDVIIQKITFLLFEKTKVLIFDNVEFEQISQQINLYTKELFFQFKKDLNASNE